VQNDTKLCEKVRNLFSKIMRKITLFLFLTEEAKNVTQISKKAEVLNTMRKLVLYYMRKESETKRKRCETKRNRYKTNGKRCETKLIFMFICYTNWCETGCVSLPFRMKARKKNSREKGTPSCTLTMLCDTPITLGLRKVKILHPSSCYKIEIRGLHFT
jgi:hypothetical protein